MTIPRPEAANAWGRVNERLSILERQLRELASATGTLNAVMPGGRIQVTDGAGNVIASWGNFETLVNNLAGAYLMTDVQGVAITNPGGQNLFRAIRIVEGDFAGQDAVSFGDFAIPGAIEAFSVWSQVASINTVGRATIDGDGGIDLLTGGSLRLYELPTTGSAANLRLDPGTVQIQYVTSSRRYKDDVEDAVIEPREVLRLQPRTWVDKGTKERSEPGAEIPRNVGFIAEELHAIPSMRQFVDYIEDDHGDLIPDAIQYDRLAAALLVLAKDQQTQIDALTKRLDKLEGGS